MRRRAKAAKARVGAKPPAARKAPKKDGSRTKDLEKRLEDALKREAQALKRAAEAQEQQTATAEVLQIISRSPTDLQPVLDTIVKSAARFCGAEDATIAQLEGAHLRAAAHHGPIAIPLGLLVRVVPGSVGGRCVLERRAIHTRDILADAKEFPETAATAREFGYRTILCVPLLREGAVIGTIHVRRTELDPFSNKQIALLQIFADQAVIAIENVRLFRELQEKNRALTQAHAQVSEALEQRTATAEILRVISTSPTDLQPVLDAVVKSAARFCGAYDATLFQLDGASLRRAAHSGPIPFPIGTLLPLGRGAVSGRAVLERRAVHVVDLVAAAEEFPVSSGFARELGHRTQLTVPLLREGMAIGAISLRRAEVNPFTEKEIELLKTFADQAVIAIENVRLFKELQEKNEALTQAHAQVTESLEQQTAASEILRLIASSPTDVQPVFDTILASATTLLDGFVASITRRVGDDVHMAAFTSMGESLDAAVRRLYPVSIDSPNPHSVAIRRCEPHIIADADTQSDIPEAVRRMARARGWRSNLAVPLRRTGTAIGALAVSRRDARGFTPSEVALLQTFADQAVIAIENVRLFTELEARNRDLIEALEQQTATAEILRAISTSPTDLQPVMNALVENAARLCAAADAAIHLVEGDLLEVAANYVSIPGLAPLGAFPLPIDRTTVTGRAVVDGLPVHVQDLTEADEAEFPVGRESARRLGHRTTLAVPLLREGAAIGAILIRRREVRPFTDRQIALLQTFADQAVIAIENVRLFKELQARTTELTQSVEKLTALGEVSRAVSSTLDIEMVLDTIVSRATQLAGADGCAISEYDDATELFHVRATHGIDATLIGTLRTMPLLRKGEGVMGRAAETREPTQIADIAVPGAYQSPLRDVLIGAGFRAVLSVPLLREEQIIGSLSLNRKAPGEFSPEVVEVLKTFATQSALAIQNARLFREIADKSAQLEAASRHKSEFLANMSHELRTPLNAIIGFSEILAEKMFGDINEKQTEYLHDILESGRHLLSLINDILDLSKVEAGRMELETTDFDLPSAIDNALILVRERATRRGITLGRTIDEQLGMLRGDERKVKQVLLNLLSNALKFTPEGGRIDVSARLQGGAAEIAVADTGVGIAPEDQEAVFEEFRQVGTADKKVEGTGLGLALSRKFIELHGGKIRVKSQVGHGSTFTFTLPMRREE